MLTPANIYALIEAMKQRNSDGTYKKILFLHSDFSGLKLMIATVTIGAVIQYVFTPPSVPLSPCPDGGCKLVTTVHAVEQPVEQVIEPVKTIKLPTNPHQGTVDQYSKQYSVDPYLVNCILFKESSYNAGAKNKTSSATGMAQFIKSTWVSFRTRMGEDTNLDLRLDPRESIKTLSWALSKGYKNHWQVVTNGSCK